MGHLFFNCFKQEGTISTLSFKRLKVVDQFIYLGNNIPSTETGVNICLVKIWNVIDYLSILRKSDLSDVIKCNFA